MRRQLLTLLPLHSLFFLLLLLLLTIGVDLSAADNTIAASNDEMQNQIQTNNVSNYNYYRLPTAIKPEKYTLQIVTHLEHANNLTYVGKVTMHLNVLQDTNNITLHSQNLTINEKELTLISVPQNNHPNCIKSTEMIKAHDYYILNLCEPVRKGERLLLTIPFSSHLNHKLRGYYRSSYHDKTSNKTRWLAITQFEPASARAAFPCFDEPEYKANFTIVLGHHKKYNALSNMPLKETRPVRNHEDWIWSEFHESVPMSTYLVAYTVNDFAFVSANTNLRNKVQFRTWARRDAIDQCDYAGVVGPKVLEYYENIFHIKFPLEKIDQIAVPDFSAGAMENWGLVTYRETALLYAKNVSSIANKQRVASVIAHELAHQWFGNLVTMKWWTDLWLNEGFATYIASLGVEHISPEWRSLEEESVDNILAIYKLDALKSSHPVSQPIHHTNEISEIFDSISYKKGSTVLRMMHNFLGDDAFHAGVHNYLKRHAYDNAEQDNLWAALTESAHEKRAIPRNFDIKQIMDSWTLQTGYPIVTVTRNYEKGSATIEQMRYLLDTEASRSASHSCWWVPLSYTTELEKNFATTSPKNWLECDEYTKVSTKIINHMPPSNEWIIFNIQMTGLYKVKYDERNWNMLINTLMTDDFEKIHTINRAQLIDDALSLAWSSDQDYGIAMHLIEYLVREKEYIPWKAALDNLSAVNRILRPTPKYEYFKKYMRKILTPIYFHLHGLNETKTAKESTSAILHKVLIGGWSCRFEIEDCVSSAKAYFKQWRHTPNPDIQNPVPINLRGVVYCTAMRHGNDDDWHFLWARYKSSNVAAEKKTIISALGCTREIWLLQRYLDWSFSGGEHIRKQDSFFAFGSVARGEIGFHLAKDYFLSNIEFLYNFYEPDTSELTRLITPLASQMSNKRDFEELREFTEKYKKIFLKSEQGVRRALETIQINAQWKERNYLDISQRIQSRL